MCRRFCLSDGRVNDPCNDSPDNMTDPPFSTGDERRVPGKGSREMDQRLWMALGDIPSGDAGNRAKYRRLGQSLELFLADDDAVEQLENDS